MSKQDFEFAAFPDAQHVAQCLRSIAQGLEHRKLRIACGEEVFELSVPGHVEFRPHARPGGSGVTANDAA